MTEAMYTKKSTKQLKRERQDAEACVSYVLTKYVMEKVNLAISEEHRNLNNTEEEKEELAAGPNGNYNKFFSCKKEDQIVEDSNHSSSTEKLKTQKTMTKILQRKMEILVPPS